MRLLLDSHALIWAADDPAKLAAVAEGVIRDPLNERVISAATIWEIAIKVGKGRLPLSLPYRQWMDKAIADLCLTILPIELDHAERQSTLPTHHNDPFDRCWRRRLWSRVCRWSAPTRSSTPTVLLESGTEPEPA